MRAADFIGQLGDPRYLQNANALYYEFAETGVNVEFGYTSAADLIDLYPQFHFKASPPIFVLQSATSTLPQAGADGSIAFMAISFVPNGTLWIEIRPSY
jgi:hypothetical protein